MLHSTLATNAHFLKQSRNLVPSFGRCLCIRLRDGVRGPCIRLTAAVILVSHAAL